MAQKKEIAKTKVNLPAVEITPEELKTYLAGEGVNLNEKEFAYFLQLARTQNLNPFKREIYVIKNSNGKVDFVTSYEVYLRRAEDSGDLDGWEVELEGNEPNTAKAVVTIYRKSWSKPFRWTVYGSEFNKPSSTGKGAWDKMWRHMLRIRAISQAFRIAFPKQTEGLPYTPEELQTSGWEKQEGEVKPVKNLKTETEKLKEKIKSAEDKELKDMRNKVGNAILKMMNGDKDHARKWLQEATGKELKELTLQELKDIWNDLQGIIEAEIEE